MGMFDFRSKAERERDYQAFYRRVFPEGERQKLQVERKLRERLPGEDLPYVMMYYVTVKNWLAQDETLDFEGAAHRASGSMSVVGITPGILEVVRQVMAEDGMASRM